MGFWEWGPSSLLEVGLHHPEPLVDTERDLGEARKEDAKAHRARSTPLVKRKLTGSEEFLSRRVSLLSIT